MVAPVLSYPIVVIMKSRDFILSKVQKNLPQATPLPEVQGDWLRYDDPIAQFCTVLAGVGGQAELIDDLAQVPQRLREFDCFPECQQIVCRVPGMEMGNFDADAVADPHQLDDVDLAILPGRLAVAENAAVWVDDRELRHRALYFITQHLVLIVSRQQIVHNLHEAYARLEFNSAGYGLFISGPSKTADIEQSLVIGAHGPRSLHVFLTP